MNEVAETLTTVMEVQESTPEVTPEPIKKYRGVFQRKGAKNYYTTVVLNADAEGKRKQKYVGSFNTQEEAALARNAYIEENNLTCRKTEM